VVVFVVVRPPPQEGGTRTFKFAFIVISRTILSHSEVTCGVNVSVVGGHKTVKDVSMTLLVNVEQFNSHIFVIVQLVFISPTKIVAFQVQSTL